MPTRKVITGEISYDTKTKIVYWDMYCKMTPYLSKVYESLKFLILTVLMAVSVGTALTKQEIDNVWEKMTIIEQKIEMQEKEKKPEELNKRSDTKWDSKIVRALNAITEEKEKSESNAEESAQSLLHGN